MLYGIDSFLLTSDNNGSSFFDSDILIILCCFLVLCTLVLRYILVLLFGTFRLPFHSISFYLVLLWDFLLQRLNVIKDSKFKNEVSSLLTDSTRQTESVPAFKSFDHTSVEGEHVAVTNSVY